MATNNDDAPPHGKTKMIRKFTAADYGPLNVDIELNGKNLELQSHINNFRGGSYRITTPVDDELELHRLYGGNAEASGQYWTIEPRDGNFGYQIDYAMLPKWNTLSESVKLYVPPGIVLFEGYASPQRSGSGHFGGGNWQVFIPFPVVDAILKAQQAAKESGDFSEVKKFLQEAMSVQKLILNKYDQQIEKLSEEKLESFCTLEKAKELLQTGNAMQHLPQRMRSALQPGSSEVTCSGTDSDPPTESYVVHRQEICLPSGITVTATLRARLEFSHETTRVTHSGGTTTTVITRHFKCIMEWV